MAVNDTVDAVGFDFIRTPDLEYSVGQIAYQGELRQAFIHIDSFYSEAAVREPMKKRGNRESLSMVMVDYDYDAEADVFELDAVFYAGDIEAAGWQVQFPVDRVGEKMMAVFLDVYGNEARVVIPAVGFEAVWLAENSDVPKATAPVNTEARTDRQANFALRRTATRGRAKADKQSERKAAPQRRAG